jgi:hypothetical protein
MSEIIVGNEYTRPLGATKQFVTITGINDDGTVSVVSKSGKQKFKTRIENVERWTLVKAAVEVRTAPKRVAKSVNINGDGTVTVSKRLNERTLVDVLVDTIKASGKPMSARELVEKVKADGSYKFKETAKTPWNSASSRLNTYIHRQGESSEIKVIARGRFVNKDYVAES